MRTLLAELKEELLTALAGWREVVDSLTGMETVVGSAVTHRMQTRKDHALLNCWETTDAKLSAELYNSKVRTTQ